MKSYKPIADPFTTSQQVAPRIPSLFEKAELLSLLLDNIESKQFGIEEEEIANAKALIDSAYVAVYDIYETEEKSGHAGKLMSVVWSTEPADHDVFVWRNDVLRSISQET